jgi:hypothetical protein
MTRFSRLARFCAALACIATAGTLRADRASDLAAIHVEAIGGRERIAALHAMHATGQVIAGGKRMHFTMTAARPDKIRLETDLGGRSLVQVSDGVAAPWEFDTGDWPPRYRTMQPAVAKTFAADAEFDDPLVAGAERGFTFEFGGEVTVGDKKALRIMVTRRLTQTFALLLDPDTYFIIRRIDERPNPIGGMSQVVTIFDDYRPVDGVLVPHRIGLFIDGKVRQQTLIESVQANPDLSDETFVRPMIKAR